MAKITDTGNNYSPDAEEVAKGVHRAMAGFPAMSDGTYSIAYAVSESDGIMVSDSTGTLKKSTLTPTTISTHISNSLSTTSNNTFTGTNEFQGYIGFYSTTPIAQEATIADAGLTSSASGGAYTGIDNAQAGSVYAQLTDLNALRVKYDQAQVDIADLRTKFNTLLASMKAYGLLDT